MDKELIEMLSLLNSNMDKGFTELNNRIDTVDSKIDGLENRFSGLETKFDSLENKFSGLETKFDGLENKFSGLETKFSGLETKFDGLENKFDTLEMKVDTLEVKVDTGFSSMKDMLHGIGKQFEQDNEQKETSVDEIKQDLKFVTHKLNRVEKDVFNLDGRQ